jgi:hypothetical protein
MFIFSTEGKCQSTILVCPSVAELSESTYKVVSINIKHRIILFLFAYSPMQSVDFTLVVPMNK